MQDRMQSDSRLLDLVYRIVFGSLFPLFHFAARSFARRERGHEIADQIANAFLTLRPKYLEAILGNTAQVLGLKPSHPEVDRASREMVRQHARAWALGVASPAEIDRVNILRATYLAMRRAVEALALEPDCLLVDALTIPGLTLPQRPIVKGDALSVSIAAASVVAKVARDGMMRECDARHPGYGLARNMGYGSALHRAALQRLGPSAIHRRSFQGTQRWLF